MRIAYADPPYLGHAARRYGRLHAHAADYDRVDTHRDLIDRLSADYDGLALSCHSPALRTLLPLCPSDVRVLAWVKPFASWKPSVRVAYAWEPILVRGGRTRARHQPTVRDWIAESITLRRGFCGAKPEAVVWWLCEVLGMEPDDEFDDLFPGSGAVGRAWERWRTRRAPIQEGLFA